MSQSIDVPPVTGDVAGSIEEFRSDAASGIAVLDSRWALALEFEAPYVLDRLLSEGVVDTRCQAQELFSEAKKYLVLCELSPDTAIGMYSGLVDAAWHAFILFTAEYIEYGQRFFWSLSGSLPRRCRVQALCWSRAQPWSAQAEGDVP